MWEDLPLKVSTKVRHLMQEQGDTSLILALCENSQGTMKVAEKTMLFSTNFIIDRPFEDEIVCRLRSLHT